ncbi:MAG: thiol:disulfide interchange protein DsbA/DsbL [Thermomonas sp.]
MRTLMLVLTLLLASALPVHAQPAPALRGLTEGVQYTAIEGGKPFRQQGPGKIEIVEVFSYTCPHCAYFQPKLEAWQATLPKSVAVSYMHAAFQPEDPFMLGYLAADAARAVPLTHHRMFAAVHETGEMPRNATLQQVTSFYLRLPGVNGKAFSAALADQTGMTRKMQAARDFQVRSNIPGTPALIVDGRYMVLGNSYESLLGNTRKIIDAITASRKPAGKASTKPRS